MARRNYSAPANLDATAALISALDSELRIQILLMLAEKNHVVHELVAKLNKSQPLISQHLRVLKATNLVASARSGREVIYSLPSLEIVDTIYALADVAGRAMPNGPDESAWPRNSKSARSVASVAKLAKVAKVAKEAGSTEATSSTGPAKATEATGRTGVSDAAIKSERTASPAQSLKTSPTSAQSSASNPDDNDDLATKRRQKRPDYLGSSVPLDEINAVADFHSGYLSPGSGAGANAAIVDDAQTPSADTDPGLTPQTPHPPQH